jgi:signal transduction histidine kinase
VPTLLTALSWILGIAAVGGVCAAIRQTALTKRLRLALAASQAATGAAQEGERGAREEAERTSRTRAQFLGMVSHELRTPMMTLQLQFERLERALGTRETPEHERQILGRINLSTRRLGEVVESLLSYSAIQSGRMKMVRERFDPEPVIEAIVEEMRPAAEQKGLAIRNIAGGSEEIETDPRLFRLVLVNLTLNAIKFTQTGFIEVNVLRLDRGFALTVRDSGPGIPESERARIFEPFEQIEPLRTKHARGMGLGLTIVRDIATTLGATLQLDSELGVGSAFTVIFPSNQAQ